MTSTQTILVVVVISLTLLLAVIGVQVLLVIMDMRKAVRRINNILEDSLIGGGLLQPNKLTSILEMFGKKKKMETHGEKTS